MTRRVPLLAFVMLASTAATADDMGARLFEPCRACHSLDPARRGLPGPNLADLLGRRVGGDPAFDYSPALRKARDQGLVWDTTRLDTFLADPTGMFPGIWMATRGVDDPGERSALARFLSRSSR